MHFILFLTFSISFIFSSCSKKEAKSEITKIPHNHLGHANEHMHKTPIHELIKRFDKKGRKEWQKPELVIEYFGDMGGKTYMDIGAGSGYFSFFMAKKAGRIFAADVNVKFLEHIARKTKELKVDNIDTLLIPYSGPSGIKDSLDGILIVNTYHHISSRVSYFKKLRTIIVNNGLLIVVDFKKEQISEDIPGPPKKMRMSSMFIKNELLKSGFQTIKIDSTSLPFQYIITAY